MTNRAKWLLAAAIGIVIVLILGISIYSSVTALFYRTQPQITTTQPEALKRETGEAPPAQLGEAPAEKDKQDRLIIRNKSIKLEVKSVKKSYSQIEKITIKYEGSITSSQIYSNSSPTPVPLEEAQSTSVTKSMSALITVKVPVKNFDPAVKDLKKLGELKSEQEATEEVTERYIDLKARLRNLQRQESRYLDILDLAKKVEEVLKVENELTRIRGEIESLQAQIDYLERSAAMATITLELSEPKTITEPVWKWGLKDAVIRAIKNFIVVVNLFIVIIGTLLPLIILGFLIWFGIYSWRKLARRST